MGNFEGLKIKEIKGHVNSKHCLQGRFNHKVNSFHNYTLEENIKISPLLQAKDEDDFVFRMEEYERSRIS